MVHGVVQCHIACLLVVTLTNELEGLVLHPWGRCSHVEEFSALWRQLGFHSSPNSWCYYVDEQESSLHPERHSQEVSDGTCVSFYKILNLLSLCVLMELSKTANTGYTICILYQNSLCKTVHLLHSSRSTHSRRKSYSKTIQLSNVAY